jgi:hypothetical protein
VLVSPPGSLRPDAHLPFWFSLSSCSSTTLVLSADLLICLSGSLAYNDHLPM